MKLYQQIPSSKPTNAYKNVTVAPLQLPATNTANLNSPRSPSKTKIKIVSSLNRSSSSAFAPKNNPSLLPPTNQTVCSPRNSAHIQLGGRSVSKNKENQCLSSKAMVNVKSGVILYNVQRPVEKKNVVGLEHSTRILTMPQQIRARSPSQRIIINNKFFQPIVSRESAPIPFAVRRNSNLTASPTQNGGGFPDSRVGLPTELAIREENNMQELKECYQSELKEIKKLREEIFQNNIEIKQLLKSSKASKEQIRSKTNIDDNLDNGQTLEAKNFQDQNESSLVRHKQFINEYKQAPICSKKTLIQGLDFQTSNKLDGLQQKRSNEGVQTDDKIDFSDFSGNSWKCTRKQSKLALTKNQECQVQWVQSPKKIDLQLEKSLGGSIIYQNSQSIPEIPKNQVKIVKQKLKQVQRKSLASITQIHPQLNSPSGSNTKLKVPSQRVIDPQNIHKQQKSTVKVPSQVNISKSAIKYASTMAAPVTSNYAQEIQEDEDNPMPVSQEILKEPQAQVFLGSKTVNNSKKQILVNSSQKSISVQSIGTQEKASSRVEQLIPQSQQKKQVRKINNRIYL